MTRTITIETTSGKYTGEIATIESTRLGYQEHGILTADLTLRWGASGVSVGGYALDKPRSSDVKDHSREGTAFGLDQIIWIMRTVGVENWEDLQGKQVIVLFDGDDSPTSRAVGIASTTDQYAVLDFKLHALSWKDKENAA